MEGLLVIGGCLLLSIILKWIEYLTTQDEENIDITNPEELRKFLDKHKGDPD